MLPGGCGATRVCRNQMATSTTGGALMHRRVRGAVARYRQTCDCSLDVAAVSPDKTCFD